MECWDHFPCCSTSSESLFKASKENRSETNMQANELIWPPSWNLDTNLSLDIWQSPVSDHPRFWNKKTAPGISGNIDVHTCAYSTMHTVCYASPLSLAKPDKWPFRFSMEPSVQTIKLLNLKCGEAPAVSGAAKSRQWSTFTWMDFYSQLGYQKSISNISLIIPPCNTLSLLSLSLYLSSLHYHCLLSLINSLSIIYLFCYPTPVCIIHTFYYCPSIIPVSTIPLSCPNLSYPDLFFYPDLFSIIQLSSFDPFRFNLPKTILPSLIPPLLSRPTFSQPQLSLCTSIISLPIVPFSTYHTQFIHLSISSLRLSYPPLY